MWWCKSSACSLALVYQVFAKKVYGGEEGMARQRAGMDELHQVDSAAHTSCHLTVAGIVATRRATNANSTDRERSA
jgi:hypothetical protein